MRLCTGGFVDAAAVEKFIAGVRRQHKLIRQFVYASGPSFDFWFMGMIPDDQWHAVVNSDINGAFHFIQGSLRVLQQQRCGGNLIAVITAAVGRTPVKDVLSAAPKAAIQMMIRSVAKESGRYGVRANCVGPGWIDSGLGMVALAEKLDDKTREQLRKKNIPLQKFGIADDIAYATLFLCSQQANYITGQTLAVDGGLQI